MKLKITTTYDNVSEAFINDFCDGVVDVKTVPGDKEFLQRKLKEKSYYSYTSYDPDPRSQLKATTEIRIED